MFILSPKQAFFLDLEDCYFYQPKTQSLQEILRIPLYAKVGFDVLRISAPLPAQSPAAKGDTGNGDCEYNDQGRIKANRA